MIDTHNHLFAPRVETFIWKDTIISITIYDAPGYKDCRLNLVPPHFTKRDMVRLGKEIRRRYGNVWGDIE